MDLKNNTLVVGLLALILGLLIGYAFGVNSADRGMWGGMWGSHMYDERYENRSDMMNEYDDEIIRRDGAMQHAMDEMMMGYRGLEGEAYEEAFLKGMIVHHIGAINMAEELKEQTDRPELEALADDIIETQQAEVEMMRGWLDAWFTE